MRDHASKILFLAIIFLPVLLLSGTALYGGSVPLEGRVVDEFEFLEASENEVEIVFFGYVGCSFICPNSLFKIGATLDELKAENPDAEIGGYFVDVNAETQVQRASEYGSHFSKFIEGVNVDAETLKSLRSEFGLTVFDTNRTVDEIIHTDHFFILKKENDGWRISRVLANKSENIIIKQAIQQELRSTES